MFVAPRGPKDPSSGGAAQVANTYTQIYIHAIFAVQERANLIKKEWREELFKYIAGTFRNLNVKLIAIGGVEDHIHVLFALSPSMSLSDLIRDIKANSSRFINQEGWVAGKFFWQEGYGAFSCSRSQLDDVARYVLSQEKHHAKGSFKDEYRRFLERYQVEYDERYLFKWID